MNIILTFFFQESNLVSPHWIWQSFQDNGESIFQWEEYWLEKKNPHEHSDNKTTGQTPLPCCFISNSCGTQNLYGFQAVRELIWQCEILAGRIRFEEVMKSSRNGSRNLKAGGTALSPDTAAVVHRKLWASHPSVCWGVTKVPCSGDEGLN